jgi:hypothetical protein
MYSFEDLKVTIQLYHAVGVAKGDSQDDLIIIINNLDRLNSIWDL